MKGNAYWGLIGNRPVCLVCAGIISAHQRSPLVCDPFMWPTDPRWQVVVGVTAGAISLLTNWAAAASTACSSILLYLVEWAKYSKPTRTSDLSQRYFTPRLFASCPLTAATTFYPNALVWRNQWEGRIKSDPCRRVLDWYQRDHNELVAVLGTKEPTMLL